MGVPRTVAEVLQDHVPLEVEGIDRMCLNVYISGSREWQDSSGFTGDERSAAEMVPHACKRSHQAGARELRFDSGRQPRR